MATATMTITMESTKKEMVTYLTAILPAMKSAELKTKAQGLLTKYGVNERRVSKEELFSVISEDKQVMTEVVEKAKVPVKAPVENKTKKPVAGKDSKPAAESKEEVKEESPKKKKLVVGKGKKKEVEDDDEEVQEEKELTYKDVFPKKVDVEGMTFERVDLSYDEFRKVSDSDEESDVFIGVVWRKDDAKKFYAKFTDVQPPKEGFKNDIDFHQPILFNESIDRVFCSSVFTEAMIYLFKENFVKDEKGFKMMGGIPFECYRHIVEE